MEGNIDNKTSERIRLHQSHLCGVLILLTVLITDPTPYPIPERSSPTRSLSPTREGSGCAYYESDGRLDGRC